MHTENFVGCVNCQNTLCSCLAANSLNAALYVNAKASSASAW